MADNFWLHAIEQLSPEEQQGALQELRERLLASALRGEAAVNRVGRENAREDRRAVDGLGELKLRVPAQIYMYLRSKGWNPGDAFDQKFMRSRYPQTVVRCGGTRPFVGFVGTTPPTRRVKFEKKYGVVDGTKH